MPTNPMQALQTLLRLQSPSNVGSLSDRGLDVATGIDQFAPTDSELQDAQIAEGDAQAGPGGMRPTFTSSRESMRSDVMGKLKRMLLQQDIAAKQALAEKTQPEIIKGEYGVKQAEATAKAAEARAQTNQDAMLQRQQQMIEAVNGRQDKTIGAAADRQQAGFDNRAVRINSTGLSTIARERAALEAARAKQEPSSIAKMVLGRKNPVDAQIEAMDNAQQWALKIAKEQDPNTDTASALAQYGQTPSPQEIAQVERFRLMLQGQ